MVDKEAGRGFSVSEAVSLTFLGITGAARERKGQYWEVTEQSSEETGQDSAGSR